jgi:hypothetical protein
LKPGYIAAHPGEGKAAARKAAVQPKKTPCMSRPGSRVKAPAIKSPPK